MSKGNNVYFYDPAMGREGMDLATPMPLNLKEALQVFLQNILRLMRADAATVWLISKEGQEQGQKELVASSGFDCDRVSKTDEERVARVILERKMMKIDDLCQDKRLLKTELVVQKGFISYIGTPIIVKEEITGVLELFYRSSFRWTSEVADLLDIITNQILLVIYALQFLRKAHLHDKPKRSQPQSVEPERSSGVEEFISNAANQLNNVLTIVSGYAQLLKMSIQDEELKENVDAISNAVTKASTITGTLLAFAQAPQKPNKKRVSLNEVLQKTIELKSDDLNSNSIRIFKDLDPSLPLTLIDPNQLQQIFLNLITHATKVMKGMNQERRLFIVTRKVGNIVQIRFSDNSPRMPEENSSNIYRGLSTGDRDDIGAEILNSYEIMKTQGGKIWMKSESGKGTTYFVELPILIDEVPKEINGKPSNRYSCLNGKKGLLIDDDVQVMNLLSRFFRTEGCETEVVADGKLALEKLEGSSYDFILCDLKMPTMNGITLYEQLKERGLPYLEKIIFITGDAIGYDAQEFLKSVKNPILFKPFNLEEVKRTAQRVLTSS